MRSIHTISLLVHDYDEAIAFYTGKLGFSLLEDSPLDDSGKRWVMISPDGGAQDSRTTGNRGGANLLLAQASTSEQIKAVGNQAGGRVMFFLDTDDFWRDHKAMSAAGVTFMEEPRVEAYGTVAVFQDLYGNLWDLIQPT